MCKLLIIVFGTLLIQISQQQLQPKQHRTEVDSCVYGLPDQALEGPWTVSIRIDNNGKLNYFTGTIISPSSILTCASIFVPTTKLQLIPPKNITVQIIGVNISQVIQTAPVSYVKQHPGYNAQKDHWTTQVNNFAVIHLKTPLALNGKSIRPICLPRFDWDDFAERLDRRNMSAIFGGWRESHEFEKIGSNLDVVDREHCKKIWNQNDNSSYYIYRACAVFSGRRSSNNPNEYCIGKGTGVVAQLKGKTKMIGFVNNYFADAVGGPVKDGICRPGTVVPICIFSRPILDWIHYQIECGPFSYTCDNGQCVPLDALCDRTFDCYDKSDENLEDCAARNYCKEGEFSCGPYGKCIPDGRVCDGVADCERGEDEDGVKGHDGVKKCGSNNFSVLLGAMIAMAVGMVAVLLISIYLWYLWKRRNRVKLIQRKYLTEEDIHLFKYGASQQQPETKAPTGNGSRLDNANALPYDTEFELERSAITIDWNEKIGEGQFGCVFKATIAKAGQEEPMKAAAKMLKSAADLEQLKSLLVEQKIMIHVGVHPNIVNLIGAYTTNIKDNVLFIIMEYYEFKCLHKYITTHRKYGLVPLSREQNRPPPRYISMDFVSSDFNGADSGRWALQIATAMAFLASKNVIHGDLSCRNVLLDSKRTAKISDFGLSRQLYNYNIYVAKRKSLFLPWRWMAPETLSCGIFSEKSDVWSFGVTLWELFSCCSVPYGMFQFGPGFIDLISNGLRLPKPSFANDSMYALMTSCWQMNTDERPNFEVLVQQLTAQQKNQDLLNCI